MGEKINCWEFMKCGREPRESSNNQGVCPAALERRLHGVHGGVNAGRSCWCVAGTFCDGSVSGTFAKKIKDCSQCKFYQQVLREDSHRIVITREISEMLHCQLIREYEKNDSGKIEKR